MALSYIYIYINVKSRRRIGAAFVHSFYTKLILNTNLAKYPNKISHKAELLSSTLQNDKRDVQLWNKLRVSEIEMKMNSIEMSYIASAKYFFYHLVTELISCPSLSNSHKERRQGDNQYLHISSLVIHFRCRDFINGFLHCPWPPHPPVFLFRMTFITLGLQHNGRYFMIISSRVVSWEMIFVLLTIQLS